MQSFRYSGFLEYLNGLGVSISKGETFYHVHGSTGAVVVGNQKTVFLLLDGYIS